jgi:hypothetical protein
LNAIHRHFQTSSHLQTYLSDVHYRVLYHFTPNFLFYFPKHNCAHSCCISILPRCAVWSIYIQSHRFKYWKVMLLNTSLCFPMYQIFSLTFVSLVWINLPITYSLQIKWYHCHTCNSFTNAYRVGWVVGFELPMD